MKLEKEEQIREEHWNTHKTDKQRPFYRSLTATFTSLTNPEENYSLPADGSKMTPSNFFPPTDIIPSTFKKRTSTQHSHLPQRRLKTEHEESIDVHACHRT